MVLRFLTEFEKVVPPVSESSAKLNPYKLTSYNWGPDIFALVNSSQYF